jgi:cytochrome d ubiquinol oxidase subunit II
MFGTLLIGIAVGTFFTGGDFVMNKLSITQTMKPTISYWANDLHGLEAIAVPFNFGMGMIVFLAARTLGSLYVMMQIDSPDLIRRCKTQVKITGTAFVIGFVLLLVALFSMTGYSVNPESGLITPIRYKYFFNMAELVWPAIMLFTGICMVLWGLGSAYFKSGRYSFYLTGGGVVFAVWSLLICAAYNNTAFFVSAVDPQMSLTLYNSSSSEFTLKVMGYVSLLLPFVAGYIFYVWKTLTRNKVSTDDLGKPDSHKY